MLFTMTLSRTSFEGGLGRSSGWTQRSLTRHDCEPTYLEEVNPVSQEYDARCLEEDAPVFLLGSSFLTFCAEERGESSRVLGTINLSIESRDHDGREPTLPLELPILAISSCTPYAISKLEVVSFFFPWSWLRKRFESHPLNWSGSTNGKTECGRLVPRHI